MLKRLCLLILMAAAAFPAFCQQEKPVITVLDFKTNEVSQAEMASIIGLLSSALFRTDCFTVIDVSQRETVLKELRFSMSGCTDESCMLEIGKMLAAEAIVVGNLSRVGTKYVVSVKMLETETARTLSAADGIYDNLDALLAGVEPMAIRLAAPYGVAAQQEQPEQQEQPKQTTDAGWTGRAPNPKGMRTAGFVTLGASLACAGGSAFLLAQSLPTVIAYYDAKAAYEAADLTQDVTALWNEMQEAWQAAMTGGTNTDFGLGVILAGSGIALGVVSAALLVTAARAQAPAGTAGREADPGAPTVSVRILPLPGAATLSFRCRF